MENQDPNQPNPDVLKILEEASGGKIKDLEGLKGVLTEREALQARTAELEAKQNLNPFVNDFVKETNDFFAKGGTTDEFFNFMEVRKLDPDKMDAIDLVRYDYRNKYKGFSDEEIDALISKDVGDWRTTKTEDGKEITPSQAVLADIKRRSMEVGTRIREQKEKLSTPAAVIRQKEDQERTAQIEASMKGLVGLALKDFSAIPVSIREKDQDVYSFEFKLPAEFQAEAMQAILPQAIMALKSGVLPVTQAEFESKTLPALKQMANAVAFARHGQQIVETAVRDAIAKTREEEAKKYSGLSFRPGNVERQVRPDWIKEKLARDLGQK